MKLLPLKEVFSLIYIFYFLKKQNNSGFEVDELKKLNHGIDTKKLEEGITILVPAAQLSERDREIIKGIGKYRLKVYIERDDIEL